ncbi:MAG: DUF4416 family protein [Deferribacteraceae bacterium]|jgi:hypothetical protein|nr:DUF4416 family protein [Deferribacteraceae bacterium]
MVMSLSPPGNVAYFAAVMYNPLKMSNTHELLTRIWGLPALLSEEFDFNHTEYYTPEMGSGLRKYFVAFTGADGPERLPDYKLTAIEAETLFADGGKRIINIDPGYLATEKVVVASTKNFTHRIYLCKGVYGDIQLTRRKGSYIPMPWTYADYIRREASVFFNKLYALNRLPLC